MPTPLHEGDHAIILNGPFAGKVGTIVSIDPESATVLCNAFDRDTPVTVAVGDVAAPPSPGSSGRHAPD
jgi:transcription antitermination factor NusG